MQPSSWSADTSVSYGQPRSGVSPLAGRWLLLARLVWWTVTLLVVVLFVAALPTSFAHLQTLCLSCNGPQLTSQQARQLQIVGLSLPFYAAYFITLNSVFFVTYFAVACVLFWQRADDRMALISSLFLVSFGGATFPGTLDALTSLNATWGLLVAIARYLGIVFLILFSYLFPDGRFAPSWIRFVALAGLLVQMPDTFFPGSPLSFSHLPRLLVFGLFFSYLACPVVVQVYRYRRVSNVVQRQQTKWVIFGLTAAIVGFLSLLLLTATVSPTGKNNALAQLIVVSAYYLFFLLIPLTIGIAILRYRLYDIDIIVNRSLVYLALTICVVGIYVLIVVALSNLLQVQGNLWLSLGATCLVAVLFQPLRTRLQRAVNRLMYGERDDPYGVLSRLGQRLGGTLAPQAILPTLVETVAQALKLPYVAIKLEEDDALTVSHGTPTQTSLSLPLLYQGETIGEMVLAPRSPGERFSGPDRHLLEDLAHQAGIAVHAVLLTMALQHSRERLVTAREEERRRLRRDLHDGLGPTLGALTLKIGSARALYQDNPDAADTLMEELETDIMTAVADIRRLVYALRPPALDELGLIAALRGCTPQFGVQKKAERGADQADHLHISIEAPAQLPPLPAAVEVAAYRIVQEALTNVARHAHARSCVIRLVLADNLQVEILDDGTGLPALRRSGVGLTSMRERAEELGGICEIETRPTGGTRVLATLPLQRPGWQSFGVERPLRSETKE